MAWVAPPTGLTVGTCPQDTLWFYDTERDDEDDPPYVFGYSVDEQLYFEVKVPPCAGTPRLDADMTLRVCEELYPGTRENIEHDLREGRVVMLHDIRYSPDVLVVFSEGE